MDDFSTLPAKFEPEGLGPEGPGRRRRKSACVGILHAAIEYFASHGYARITPQLVAEAAGVSQWSV